MDLLAKGESGKACCLKMPWTLPVGIYLLECAEAFEIFFFTDHHEDVFLVEGVVC
jgi:hypothetical protein